MSIARPASRTASVNVSVAWVLTLSEILEEEYVMFCPPDCTMTGCGIQKKFPPPAPVMAMIRAIVSGGPGQMFENARDVVAPEVVKITGGEHCVSRPLRVRLNITALRTPAARPAPPITTEPPPEFPKIGLVTVCPASCMPGSNWNFVPFTVAFALSGAGRTSAAVMLMENWLRPTEATMPFEMLKIDEPPTIGPLRQPTIVTCWPTVGATPEINVNV